MVRVAASSTLECDFEEGFCDWQNATWSDGPWERRNYGTPTIKTGPENGHSSKTQSKSSSR